MFKKMSMGMISLVGVLFGVVIFIILYLEIRLLTLIGVPLAFFGLIFCAYLVKAKRFGLYPFKADSVSWREAKKTYENPDVPPEASKSASENPKV